MHTVDNEYRHLRRTQPLGPELEYRLRELRERPHQHVVIGRPHHGRRRLTPPVQWLRVARPPG